MTRRLLFAQYWSAAHAFFHAAGASRLVSRRSVLTCLLASTASLLLAGSGAANPEPASSVTTATVFSAGTASAARTHHGNSKSAATGKRSTNSESTASPTNSASRPPADPGTVAGAAARQHLPKEPPSPSSPPQIVIPQSPQAINNLGVPQVSLTFDDGPDAATPQILDLLRQYHVKATFCVIGVNVRAHHDLIRQMVTEGHTLCNHTWSHNLRLGTNSPDVIRADLQHTSDEIHLAAPGAPIKYFRHPGGNFTPTAVSVAHELGMTSISWDVDPRDWDIRTNGTGPGMTQHIINAVMRNTRPGSIVLSHDGGGNRVATLGAYQTLLPWLVGNYQLIALPV